MSRHQKRISAPRSWSVARKEHFWTVKPRPGPHPKDRSLPLLLLVRDILKLADNAREARKILTEGNIVVNGKVRRDYKFPVGLFDVISIPKLNEHYVMLMDRRGVLTLVPIKEEEAKMKLCRVENKTTLKGGKIQINLHDGRNLLDDSLHVKTHDSLLISLENGEVLKVLPYEEGSKVVVFGGKHTAQIGELVERIVRRSSERNVVRIRSLGFCAALSPAGETAAEEVGEIFETVEDFVFVIGTEKIEVPGLK